MPSVQYALALQHVRNFEYLPSLGSLGFMNFVTASRRLGRRRSRGWARIATAAAATAVLFLAGCSAPGTSSASGSGSSITVAYTPDIGAAPLYAAVQDGVFQRAGLTVRIQPYPSAAAEVSAIRSGKADVAVGDYANFFYAQEQDARAPMVVVADGYDAGPDVVDIMVLPDSGITNPQQLVGKTIGTAAPQLMPGNVNGQPYSLDTVSAASVLSNDGVQPMSVTWKPMPANGLIGALRSHAVNAILVTEPQIYQAESQLGAQTVLDACSGDTVSLPLDGYFASASFAKQHGATLTAFRSALMRAQAAAHRSRVQAALAHYDGMNPQTASLITLGLYPTSLKVTSLQRVASLMSFYGALPHPLDVSHMIFR
jgi:NitT/TauT family transport system substrate-binding protein